MLCKLRFLQVRNEHFFDYEISFLNATLVVSVLNGNLVADTGHPKVKGNLFYLFPKLVLYKSVLWRIRI